MILKAENIGHKINNKEIIKNISLSVSRGRIFALAGPNGSGKTTLINILCGMQNPSDGAVFVKGKNMREYSLKEKAFLSAMLPPEIALPYNFKVKDIIVMGRAPRKKWWQDYDAQDYVVSAENAAKMDIEHLLQREINTLSSGEKQKVFLAQALTQQAEILFLDEPTSHLDTGRQTELFILLKKLAAGGVSVVIVSHELTLLKKHADYALMLKDGTVVHHGRPDEVFTEKNIREVYNF